MLAEILPKLCQNSQVPKVNRRHVGAVRSLRIDVKPHLEAGCATTLLVKVNRGRRIRQKRPSKGGWSKCREGEGGGGGGLAKGNENTTHCLLMAQNVGDPRPTSS